MHVMPDLCWRHEGFVENEDGAQMAKGTRLRSNRRASKQKLRTNDLTGK